MKKYSYLFAFSLSTIFAFLFYLFNPFHSTIINYRLSVGQIADKDIIAPYDFDIQKSPEVLKKEQDKAANTVSRVYKVSETLTFNALKNLDFIFKPFRSTSPDHFQQIKAQLIQNGFQLSDDTILYLSSTENRANVYSYLSSQLAYIFNIGIFPVSYSFESINVIKDDELKKYELHQLFSLSEANNNIIKKAPYSIEKKVLQELANLLLVVNIIEDREKTEVERQKARNSVSKFSGKVLKNEKIVSKNQKITTDIFNKLNSLIEQQSDQQLGKSIKELALSSLGVFVLSLLILLVLHQTIFLFYENKLKTFNDFLILHLCLLFPIIITIFLNHFIEISSLFIPYTISIIIVTFIFNAEIGMIFNFILMIFVSLFLNWIVIPPLILCLTNIGAILTIHRLSYKQEFIVIGLYLVITSLVVNLSISFLGNNELGIFFRNVSFTIISCLFSLIIVVLILPYIQKKLNIASKQILLELLDFENPLLRRMQKQTPGTYHHSLIVGNLAESAAEAIGADYLLARVGSYYHDIGKLENAKFFIENNSESSSLHDRLMANESAVIIKNHITDGIALAKREKLPQSIINIIQQHHGTSQIRFFFHKAKETNLQIDESTFYYEGPKPQTKEAAIVMIADIVESTTKSLHEYSEEIIQKVLDETTSRLIDDKQLNEAPISLKEIELTKKFMLPILLGIYRKRIEYPE